MAKPVFKQYSYIQGLLLPPSFDELINTNHPVRIVNHVVEKIDLKLLMEQYKGGGSSSYHPKMMLKIMVYSYLRSIYSSLKYINN
jgi:transposase